MEKLDALKQWKAARFGLMVHFGLYTLPGGIWKGEEMDYVGDWIQSRFKIPCNQYQKLTQEFNPTGFDAEEWVSYAKKAGMKYLVVTAKHHDGFALYDSKVDDFNCVKASPFKRDLIGELAEACRKANFHFGVYYSQTLDWHEPNAGGTNAFGLNYGMSWFNNWDFPTEGRNFEAYFTKKCLPQIEELLTNYGPLFELWFDTPLDMPEKYSRLIRETVRRLQPNCLINSRLGGDYDYEITGDNMIPATRSNKPAEAPATLNHTWGFKKNDHDWKDSQEVIRTLSKLASLDVNYLMNVGPDSTGRFPQASQEILSEVGDWLALNGDAIFGTQPSPFEARVTWAEVTQLAKKLFFITPKGDAESITLNGLQDVPKLARILGGPTVPFESHGDALKILLPKRKAQVTFILEFSEAPKVRAGLYPQNDKLVLEAPYGKWNRIQNTDQPNQQLDADGNPVKVSGPILKRGQTFGWTSPESTMTWDAYLPEGGQWQVLVETGVAWHGQTWQEGIEVKVLSGDQICQSVLQADLRDKSPSAKEYAHITSKVGTMSLAAGEHTLTLNAITLPKASTGLHLIRLVLKKVS